MSKDQRFQPPRLSLPGSVPPPPTSLPAEFTELLEKFPLPWCVGPYGDIWVKADVERVTDPQLINQPGVVDGWRATGAKARMVMENPADKHVAAFLVWAANQMVK